MKTVLISLSIVFLWGNIVLGDPLLQPYEHVSIPSLISSLRITASLTFCGEDVPIEKFDIRERLEKELLISLWNRDQVILWIKRASRYMPIIEERLALSNMPNDLKYIAIIESDLRPHVGSPAGAIGFWQFMSYTAKKFGLTVNGEIDERRNILLSTGAALHYLKELYKKFGSWALAAAAYNMGEYGLESNLLDQQVDNYYDLYLNLETRRYLFRAIAVKMIMSNPEKYGFIFTDDDYYPPLEYDCIDFSAKRDVPINVVASAAGTTYKEIKDLNPQFRKKYIPEGDHCIFIPKESSHQFYAQYESELKKYFAEKNHMIYVVKKGDNLYSIADQFNVPMISIYNWNKLTGKHIYPGNRLIIYPQNN